MGPSRHRRRGLRDDAIPHDVPVWLVDRDAAAARGFGQGTAVPLEVAGRTQGVVTPVWSDEDGPGAVVTLCGELVPMDALPGLARQLLAAGEFALDPMDVRAVRSRVAASGRTAMPAEMVARARRTWLPTCWRCSRLTACRRGWSRTSPVSRRRPSMACGWRRRGSGPIWAALVDR